MTILYTVLSCSPSAAPSSSPPAGRGDSPCPRPACPPKRERERKKEGKRESKSKKERDTTKEKDKRAWLRRSYISPLPLPHCSWLQLPWPHPRPHLRRSQEVQDRSSAPLVRKQFPDCEPVLPSSCLFPYLCPHYLLLRPPPVAILEQVFPRLRLVLTPPALCRVRALRPLQVLACSLDFSVT